MIIHCQHGIFLDVVFRGVDSDCPDNIDSYRRRMSKSQHSRSHRWRTERLLQASMNHDSKRDCHHKNNRNSCCCLIHNPPIHSAFGRSWTSVVWLLAKEDSHNTPDSYLHTSRDTAQLYEWLRNHNQQALATALDYILLCHQYGKRPIDPSPYSYVWEHQSFVLMFHERDNRSYFCRAHIHVHYSKEQKTWGQLLPQHQ